MKVSKPEKMPQQICCSSGVAGYEPKRLLSYQISALQGQGKRSYQEDAYTIINYDDVVSMKNDGLLLVLSDGMGGRDGGKVASATAVEALTKAFAEFDRDGNLAEQLKDAVIRADVSVNRMVGAKGGGCTVVVCLIYQEKLYFVSIGDSNIYLMRNGALTQLNREQDGLQQEFVRTIRCGSMDPTSARAFPQGKNLACWLGKGVLDDIDYLRRPLRLLPGDVLMLCSDGISDYISSESLYRSMSARSPRDMTSALEDAIIEADASNQDNYSAIVVHCRY